MNALAEEVTRLRARRDQLAELIELQEQIGVMETRLLIGEKNSIVIARTVVQKVAEFYRVAPAMLTGRTRDADTAWARQVAYHLTRNLTGGSLHGVGVLFQRDHGTIRSGIEQVKARCDTHPPTLDELLKLEAQCRLALGDGKRNAEFSASAGEKQKP